jgi:hypothetical protein
MDATMLPCINPFCTQTFSPQDLEGVSTLTCPKCGAVFEFAVSSEATMHPGDTAKLPSVNPEKKVRIEAAAPPEQPQLSASLSTPPPPSITATPSAQPAAAAAGSTSLNFNSTADMVAPRRRRTVRKRGSRRRRRRIIGIVAVLGIASAVALGGWYKYLYKKPVGDGDPTRAARIYNAAFIPEKSWRRDREIQRRWHVQIGMKSSELNNSMALFFKDYKDRLPSDAEMLDEALLKLRSYFRPLEWELKPKSEPMRLAGRPAQVVEFQGDDADHVTTNGECYMMAYRGYAYWLFTWAPLGDLEKQREPIQDEWAGLRKCFSLGTERRGWKAKPRETDRIEGKNAGYVLEFVKELWTHEWGQHEDMQLEYLLRGHEPDPERKPLAGKDATVQVFVLPKQADLKSAELKSATDAALDHLKQRELKLYPRTKWERIKDKNGEFDRDAKIGNETVHWIKLHVQNTEELERYLSVAVVNRSEYAIVLVGDCLWERRDFWDQEFTALFKTFTAR